VWCGIRAVSVCKNFDLGTGHTGPAEKLPAETRGLRVLLAHRGSAARRHRLHDGVVRGRVGLGHPQVEEPLAGAQRLWWS